MSTARVIARYGNVDVHYDDTTRKVWWTSGMAIDADGSPRAYHPDGKSGLDYLANAGRPGNWWGLACDGHGQPYIQSPCDPAPGFYVSTTAGLNNPKRAPSDPLRYLDSEGRRFFVLPSHFPLHVPLLAVGKVTNTHTGVFTDAVYGDVGPGNTIGEGSIALAHALGIHPDPKYGGISAGILFELILPQG